MSVLALRRETNLSYVTLTKLYHEKTTGVTFNTIDRICKSLECGMAERFEYIEE
jgi:putative transcriptional regulator